MCGGFPSSSTQGPRPPRQTAWHAILVILGWREDR
jgi:hypothetical protein